ncbi:serine hydrolase domain-containing protein [Alcanivorax profundi]|uniref:serine hydrolase domain-containing protein n=1 Tax=Alcanivorax profundi TaxID=2338368 RepID=UPI0032B25676|tara:strand:- start:497 stop:1651 length:1155 start_codon:yes stop_codon:yes gene_type:complete
MNSIKRILCVSFVGFVFIAVPVHFWLTDPHGVMRQAFVIQAPLSKLAQQCSSNSPDWLGRISLTGVDQLKALSTQAAFLDKNGNLSHCETGWNSVIFFSDRVDANTRFRYGSLTKPLTASAIIMLVNNGKLSYQSGLADSLGYDVGSSVNQDFLAVTIEKLLLHRSGVQGHIFLNRKKPVCPDDLASFMATGKVKRAGDFEYSNMGYCLLGEVVAHKDGRPYKQAMERLYGLSERGMRFVGYQTEIDEVKRDFRFNDFYGVNNKGRFDYGAVAATAGLSGSASAYARLIKDMIHQTDEDILSGFDAECDDRSLKNCYGYAFYSYSPMNGERLYVKEGYMPGASGVVVINDEGEVFVWLGNSDTENAASGMAMKIFLDKLVGLGF